MVRRKPRCRYCRTNRYIIPIVYAVRVDEKLLQKEAAGEIKIGSGYVGIDRPNWHCKKCGSEFLR